MFWIADELSNPKKRSITELFSSIQKLTAFQSNGVAKSGNILAWRALGGWKGAH